MSKIPKSRPEAYKLFHEGSRALALVEQNGMRVDLKLLNRTIKAVQDRQNHLLVQLREDDLYKQWQKWKGSEMNLQSRPQLGHVLQHIAGIEFADDQLTATGKPKTDEQTLERVDLPFVKTYFEMAKLHKVETTYLRGIQRELIGDRIHPFFHLHKVVTFRSSSSEINFQNLPIRHPVYGKLVRRLFVPSDGNRIVEIDLQANEVRVACCYSKDKKLIHDTIEGDMHRDMAAECFKLPKEEVPKGLRQLTKGAFVFAEFYGDFYPKVARNLWEGAAADEITLKDGTPAIEHLKACGLHSLGECDPDQKPRKGTFEEHIQDVEHRFWEERFKGYNKWRIDHWNNYKRRGWFEMKTGFVVYGHYKKNEVLNSPIQGSAFHCLLWILIQLNRWLVRNKMKTMIVGQIHDSIVLDAHPTEVDDVLEKTFQLIRADIRREWPWLIIPLEGEAELSETNWWEKKEVQVP